MLAQQGEGILTSIISGLKNVGSFLRANKGNIVKKGLLPAIPAAITGAVAGASEEGARKAVKGGALAPTSGEAIFRSDGLYRDAFLGSSDLFK